MVKLTSIIDAASDVNFGKVTDSIADIAGSGGSVFAKASDDLSGVASKTDDFIDSFRTSAKKTGTDDIVGGVDGLKKFETQPGASTYASKVTTFIAKNPKLSAAGVSTLAAAGYVAYLVSSGYTVEEALDKLGSIVTDTVEDVADTLTDGTLSIGDSILKGIFGDDYLTYFKIAAGVVASVLILKIILVIKQFLPSKNVNIDN